MALERLVHALVGSVAGGAKELLIKVIKEKLMKGRLCPAHRYKAM
jgi:hypothetical protein